MDTTAIAEQIRVPLSSLFIGISLVLLTVIPYYFGLFLSWKTRDGNVSLVRLLFIPTGAIFLGAMAAIMISNIWDLFFPTRQAETLIKAFWETAPGSAGEGVAKWKNGILNLNMFFSTYLYYMIVLVPIISFIPIYFSMEELGFVKEMNMSRLKYISLKFIACAGVISILIFFYGSVINHVMFRGQSIVFRDYGSAGSARDMMVNFVKTITRMGASGKAIGGSNNANGSNNQY